MQIEAWGKRIKTSNGREFTIGSDYLIRKHGILFSAKLVAYHTPSHGLHSHFYVKNYRTGRVLTLKSTVHFV